MAYLAKVSTTTDEIVQTWSGTPEAAADFVAPTGFRKQTLDQTEWDSIKAAGNLTYPDGTHKWTYPDGGSLTPVGDPRSGLGFSTALLEILQGGSNSTTDVTCQAYNPDDSPASYTGDIALRTSDGKWIRLTFSSGTATLTISLALIRTFTIGQAGNPNYRFLTPLEVRIVGNNEI